MHLDISQEPLYTEMYRKKARDQDQPERRHTLCASLCSRHALRHFTRATLYGNVQEKRLETRTSRNADTHFVRACAVEMHVDISPEPLCARIYRKKARDQDQPERKHTLCASLRNRNALGHFTRATLYGNVQEKGSRPGPAGTQTHTLCEPVQSTCT